MGKGILVGFSVIAVTAGLMWLITQWAVFTAKIAWEYGDWIGAIFGFGPFAIFLVVFFAIVGHREGW